MIGGILVLAVSAQDSRVEIMRARQIRADRERLLEHRPRRIHVALLHRSAPKVDPAIRILRIDFGDFEKRNLRGFQIALQKESYAVIVPALPVFWLEIDLWRGGSRSHRGHGERDLIFGERDDRHVRNFFLLCRDASQRRIERELAVIVAWRDLLGMGGSRLSY